MTDFKDLLPKAKQIGTGVAAGGTTLLFVMNMLGARIDEMNKRFDEVNKRMDEKDHQLREYVNFKDSAAVREMKYLRDGQAEMKELLKALQNQNYRPIRPQRGGM